MWNHVQTNLEESKAQEIAKVQNSLQEMQNKFEETNALLIKERENVKKVVEEAPPVIKETQVIVEDTQKIETLTAEVESLKVRKFSHTRPNLLLGELISKMRLFLYKMLLLKLIAFMTIFLSLIYDLYHS